MLYQPDTFKYVNLLFVLDDRLHQYHLVEGDVLFLIAGNAAYVARRVGQPPHKEMAAIPGQVVEKTFYAGDDVKAERRWNVSLI